MTSFQTLFTSEATIPALHDTLVRKMISLWQQSQNEYHFLPLTERIYFSGRKKEKSFQHRNNGHFLQHITQIVMEDIEQENNESNEPKKKNKKSSKKSSKTVKSISIAVFLNYTDISILERTLSLLRSLTRLLELYEPVISTEPIYLEQEMNEGEVDDNNEEEEEDDDDAVIYYLRVNNIKIPTKELNSLYESLMKYTGVIQVLCPRRSIVNEEEVIATKSKISTVNWKPTRLFLLDCLTELDSNTLWAEDLNFHIYYDRIRGQDRGYNILFPQHFITPSESSFDWKFCDSSDYRRLFTALAHPHHQRFVKVIISQFKFSELTPCFSFSDD